MTHADRLVTAAMMGESWALLELADRAKDHADDVNAGRAVGDASEAFMVENVLRWLAGSCAPGVDLSTILRLQ